MSKIKQSILIMIVSVITVAGVSIAYSWTGPSESAPGGNVSAPINAGSGTQYKTGSLGISGILETYDINVKNNSDVETVYPNLAFHQHNNGDASIWIPNAGRLQFKSACAGGCGDRITFTSDGNIGIGTTNPLKVSDADKSLHISSSQAGYAAQIGVSDSNLGNSGRFLALFSGNTGGAEPTIAYSSSYPLLFGRWTNLGPTSFAETMRLTSNGNVGIGTANPSGKLSVTGDGDLGTYTLDLKRDSANKSAFLRLANSDATKWMEISGGRSGDTKARIVFSNTETFELGPATSALTPPTLGLSIDGSGNALFSQGLGVNGTLHGYSTAVFDGVIQSTTGGIKFPDGTVQTSASVGSGIPSGAVMSFNLTSCPSGWSELVSARGRYIVGLSLGGTLGATVGTILSDQENRAVGKHGHTINDPGHSHGYVKDAWGSKDTSPATGGYVNQTTATTDTATTKININDTGTVDGTNAPYIQFLTCQKD